MISSKKRYGAKAFFLFLILFVAFFALIFQLFRLSLVDYGKFLLAIFFIVYVPGQAFVWLIKLKVTRLESITLSLVLGMTSSTLVYRISGIINFWLLFIMWLAALFVIFLYKIIKNPPKKEDFAFSITWVGIVFILIAIFVVCVLFLDNYRNGIIQKDGSVRLNMHYLDGFVRNAVVRELSHSIPPQMPFAAGFSLSYHHGMDIFVSLFYKHLNIGVLDLLHRLTMTFYFALLLMTVFIFSRKWMRSDKAALMGVFLVVFGSGGFGYIGGLLTDYASYWGKIFYSFYFLDILSLNSFLPSISILCAGFFCLWMYLKFRKFSWLILACFLLAAITDYKMTYAAPILGALALSGAVHLGLHRETSTIKALLLTGLILSPLVLLAYFHNQNGPQYVPGVRFNNWVIFSLADLKLSFLGKAWGGLTRHAHLTVTNILLAVPIFVGFLFGSFGLSSFALPGLFRKFFIFRKLDRMRVFLIFFFFIGIIYFFIFSPSLGGRPRNWTNIYVFYLSVIILIFFWSERLVFFLETKKRLLRIAVLSLIIILSIPNVIHFLWAKVHFPQQKVFDSYYMEACTWLNECTKKEDVVIHSSNTAHVCYFVDRRVVLDQSPHSYLTFHLTTNQIKERQNDIHRFFLDPVINADVLDKYKVSHVWVRNKREFTLVKKNENNKIDCFSYIGGTKIKKYFKTHALNLSFENQDYSIYAVNKHEDKDKEVYVLEREGPVRKLKKFSEIY